MVKRNTDHRIDVDSGFFLYLALMLVLVPIRWILAMGISVIVHELGHILAICAMRIPILKISLKAMGVRIHTPPMKTSQELLCAAAGPAAGISLILLAKWLPATAVCAAFHCIYNLLPVYPADGGRVLYSGLRLCVQEATAVRVVGIVRQFLFLVLFCIGIVCILALVKRK